MTAEWGGILKRKVWRTVNDSMIQKGAAAWQFFRYYFKNNLARDQIRLAYGKFGQMAISKTILRNTSTEFLGLCLGNQVWAALLWPLRQVDGPCRQDRVYFCLDTDNVSAAAEFHFFEQPECWEVIMNYEILFHDSQVILDCPLHESEPLLKFFLRAPARINQLSRTDLETISEKFMMPPCFGDRDTIRQLPPKDLLASIIDFASNGDADYIEEVHESLKQNKSSAADEKAHDDDNDFGGALDELVLLDLPAEERRDFEEVAKAIEKKVKADWTNCLVVAKAKGKAKAKAKAKSKAKAEAKAKAKVRKAARVFNSRKRRREQAIAPIEDATVIGRDCNCFFY